MVWKEAAMVTFKVLAAYLPEELGKTTEILSQYSRLTRLRFELASRGYRSKPRAWANNFQSSVSFLFLFLPLEKPWNAFSLQFLGLLGRGINPSQGLYLHTGQHKHRINIHTLTPNIHARSGIRTHDRSVRASEDSSCIRPLSYSDRLSLVYET
jgi:hypothetical protein